MAQPLSHAQWGQAWRGALPGPPPGWRLGRILGARLRAQGGGGRKAGVQRGWLGRARPKDEARPWAHTVTGG